MLDGGSCCQRQNGGKSQKLKKSREENCLNVRVYKAFEPNPPRETPPQGMGTIEE